MLVITRRIDEEIVIDGRIRIKVLGVDRGKVKLGFLAPKEVSIKRAELLPTESAEEAESEIV
jgi:carbon storage regulator